MPVERGYKVEGHVIELVGQGAGACSGDLGVDERYHFVALHCSLPMNQVGNSVLLLFLWVLSY